MKKTNTYNKKTQKIARHRTYVKDTRIRQTSRNNTKEQSHTKKTIEETQKQNKQQGQLILLVRDSEELEN